MCARLGQLSRFWADRRYVADSWKVGVLLEGAVERGAVETAIRKLMEDEEGEGVQ